MKKILLILLLLTATTLAQDGWWWKWGIGKAQYTGSWTPANLPIDTTTTSVFFYGEAPKTKVAKDSGGVSVRPYMRVWDDTIGIVTNETFDSDISGWNLRTSPPDTFKWVSNYGGFTGVAHVYSTGINEVVYYPYSTNDDLIEVEANTVYHFSADLVIAELTGESLKQVAIGLNTLNPLIYFSFENTGTYHIDTTFIPISSGYISFSSLSIPSGVQSYYFDNVKLDKLYSDSTYGYVHTISPPNDTATYYYSQSVKWIQKDKDTIWLAAATDTVVIPAGFDVDVSIRGEGSVTGEGKYTYGSEVTLTAIADEGYTFSNWNTDLNKTDNPLVFNMQPNDTALVARFTRNTPLADVIINNNPVDSLHEGNVSDAFIEGYECNGAIWNGTILTIEATLASCLSRNDTIGAEIVIRSTSGMSSYISTADAYYPIMLAMPAGSNTYFQVYNSGGTMPTSIIVTGAGDAANETGYDVEFFSPDPITGEPDLSSYSNGYIAGVMKYLSEELGVSVWDIRDTLQTRLGGSWTSQEGYGLVDCDLVQTILGGGSPASINYMKTAEGDTMLTAEGDTMKTSYNFNFNKTNGEKNEEDIILPQRVYAILNSKRTMGFTV